MSTTSLRFSAFQGMRRIASGTLVDAAMATRKALEEDPRHTVLVFDDRTGRQIDLDLRGTPEEIRTRMTEAADAAAEAATPDAVDEALAPRKGPGRPRLGVVAKEVTLLPRHWAWLSTQRGGASATLRRLVDQARKAGERQDEVRTGQDAAFRFMSARPAIFPATKRPCGPSSRTTR